MSLRFDRPKRSCPLCRAVYLRPLSTCPADQSTLHSFPQDPLVGHTVGARYLIEAVLREGAVGRVYQGSDPSGAEVAVHVLYGEYAATEQARQQFVHAAEIASSVMHPKVASVIDFGESAGGMPFLVTPLMEGRRLDELIEQEGPLSSARACAIFRDICDGVTEIHRRGIIHQDLNPSLVVLDSGIDTGTATIAIVGEALLTRPLRDGRLGAHRIWGTPAYIAPERMLATTSDHRVDLFSLGVMFYEMLSGVLPYQGPHLMRAMIGAAPPAMHTLVCGLRVDPAAEAIALRLIQPDPANRYPDVDSIIAALEVLP